ncbi:hypothetical protein DFH09DRAFT_1085098 [Mycena vulgaris]|nr:hypothetical protein DFH09DRAFT_1085098 [Mycena vulgaris]
MVFGAMTLKSGAEETRRQTQMRGALKNIRVTYFEADSVSRKSTEFLERIDDSEFRKKLNAEDPERCGKNILTISLGGFGDHWQRQPKFKVQEMYFQVFGLITTKLESYLYWSSFRSEIYEKAYVVPAGSGLILPLSPLFMLQSHGPPNCEPLDMPEAATAPRSVSATRTKQTAPGASFAPRRADKYLKATISPRGSITRSTPGCRLADGLCVLYAPLDRGDDAPDCARRLTGSGTSMSSTWRADPNMERRGLSYILRYSFGASLGT